MGAGTRAARVVQVITARLRGASSSAALAGASVAAVNRLQVLLDWRLRLLHVMYLPMSLLLVIEKIECEQRIRRLLREEPVAAAIIMLLFVNIRIVLSSLPSKLEIVIQERRCEVI